MVKITYDNITQGGAKNIVEYWSDKKALKRKAFLRQDGDFNNIKVEYITLIDYLKRA